MLKIQYYPNTKILRLRVTEKEYLNRLELISKEVGLSVNDLTSKIKYSTYRMKARFIEINHVEFCSKNQHKIIQALNNKQPI